MGPNQIFDKGMVAATAVPLYRVVKLTAVETAAVMDTAGADWIGVSQEEVDAEDVANGRVFRVRLMGITRCVASAAVSLNAKVASTNDGRVATATTGQNVIGRALTPATAAGQWINVLLTPGAPVAA